MPPPGPSVAILLASYDGEPFIDAQIASLAAQQGVGRIDIHVSDDGSRDGTGARLEAWRRHWDRGSFEVSAGPGRGFAENFRALATGLLPSTDYVAFCDQDDLWDEDKLEAATGILSRHVPGGPGLYLSRTRLIDVDGVTLGFSPLFRRPPSFRNAIVQSIGGGNTIVLNRDGFELFAESVRRTPFVSHDWWSYIMVSGAGGFVHYDPQPHIGYRQHGGNLVGQNTGLRARLQRFSQMLEGRFSRWTSQNLDGLDKCADLLSEDSRAVAAALRHIRNAGFPANVAGLLQSGIRRQTTLADLTLAVAITLGKL